MEELACIVETTQGAGRQAIVSVDGLRLVVVDEFSGAGRFASPPCSLVSLGLQVVVEPRWSWSDAHAGNPAQEQKLEHLHGFAYEAFGRIAELDPVPKIDCGPLSFCMPQIPGGPPGIGLFVQVPIRQIVLHQLDSGV